VKKGISPFIASVLLIAFAITIAGIYRAWIVGFTKEATEEVGKHSEKKITCSYGGIALYDLTFNTTSGNLTGKIENTNLIPLGNISLEVFYSNATREEKSLNMILEPGERNVFNVKLGCDKTNPNYEKIRVVTNCSNVYDEVSSSDIPQV